jgi:hypothetical protein
MFLGNSGRKFHGIIDTLTRFHSLVPFSFWGITIHSELRAKFKKKTQKQKNQQQQDIGIAVYVASPPGHTCWGF